MPAALHIQNLTKIYNNKLCALKGITLTVEQGDFFALLGSNGAGKTTAIGIICGLLNKTYGKVEILGLNQDSHLFQVKRLIGLMPQEFNFNPFEPISEILINQAGYYGISKANVMPELQILLKEVGLWSKRFEMAKSLSGGMKRRLMLARALIHQPKILILDEPTAGVDVEIRHSMWAFFKRLNQQGVTIILTTHYLEEAESLCRNIAILDEGEIIKQTSMKKLLSAAKKQILILESVKKLPETIHNEQFECEQLDDYSLQVTLKSTVNISQVLQNLAAQNIMIKHIRSTQNRLETLFLDLTNQH